MTQKIEISPSSVADFIAMAGELPPVRAHAFTGKRGDEILGIGGIANLPDGTKLAFAHLNDEARKYPVSLHRAALMTMKLARESGVKRLVAIADKSQPAARRWLERLGFQSEIKDGIEVFIYAAD